MAIFETVFTLQRFYKVPRAEIRDALLPIINLPGIVLPRKRKFKEVFDLYVAYTISFADAYFAVEMKALKLTDILTFDQRFDRIPGISRLEP